MNNIKYLCTRKNITFKELSKASQTSLSFIYAVANDSQVPNIKIASRIAKALNSSLEEVFPIETKNIDNLKDGGQHE